MSGPRETHDAARARIAILALALGGFAIGTTEFVTMGLLPDISHTIHHSIASTGNIITAYAFGVVVGTPVIAGLVAHLPRRELAAGLCLFLALGNLLTAVMSTYVSLLGARFVAGWCHGAYFGTASLVAASLVPPARRARSVAMVMQGLAVANVVGVPFGTFLGQHFGWRVAYFLVAGLFVLTALSVMALVPHTPGDHTASMRSELAALRRPQVIVAAVAGMIGFGGLFAFYSYIAPLVTDVAHLHKSAIPWFLLAFGLGLVFGNWVAGHLGDRDHERSVVGGFVGSIVLLVLVWLLSPYAVCLALGGFLVGACAQVVAINLQIRLMEAAGSAQMLGAGLNHSSLNFANGLGALVGSLAIQAGWGYRVPSLLGAGLAVLGLAIFVVGRRWSGPAAAHA